MKMKKSLVLTSLICSTVIYAGDVNPKSIKIQEGIKYIKILGKTLKNNLEAEMKADQTGLKGMNFCSTKADILTKEVNSNLPKGVSVRRTALKLRATDNKADAIDIKIMNEILSGIKDKKDKMGKPKLVEIDNSFRVYKPLFVQPACMKCHGDNKTINPEVQKVITKKYPNDKAIGFKEGDFRGLIVAEINRK